MSAIKAWQEDTQTATTAALFAARLPTFGERLQAVTAAFRQCGEASLRYSEPARVRRELVHLNVER